MGSQRAGHDGGTEHMRHDGFDKMCLRGDGVRAHTSKSGWFLLGIGKYAVLFIVFACLVYTFTINVGFLCN